MWSADMCHPEEVPVSPWPAACLSWGGEPEPPPTAETLLPLSESTKSAVSAGGSIAPAPQPVCRLVSLCSGQRSPALPCARVTSEQGIIYPADVNENTSTVLLHE